MLIFDRMVSNTTRRVCRKRQVSSDPLLPISRHSNEVSMHTPWLHLRKFLLERLPSISKRHCAHLANSKAYSKRVVGLIPISGSILSQP